MSKTIKFLLLCTLVAAILMPFVVLSGWLLPFYKVIAGLFLIIGIGSLILSGFSESGQEFFAASVGVAIGSLAGFYLLIPFIAPFIPGLPAAVLAAL